MGEVLLDDLVEISLVDVGVPDRLRIDHHYRPLVAAAEATGRVDADEILVGRDAQHLDLVLDVIARLFGMMVGLAILAFPTLVDAEEHMLMVMTHLLPSSW